MSKAVVVETQRQHVGVGVIESLNACITITRVEMVVEPNIDVVRRGVLIGFITKLGSRLCGVSARRNLNQSSHYQQLLLELVFTNLITTIHGNRT
jgi:hypothetical protein